MNQTLALLGDAYRELNARKMFWISLIILGLVVGIFALVGIGDGGLTFAGMNLGLRPAQFIYKYAFSRLVIFLWVSKGAMVLALISTASVFPELISGGSIDLYLSKPLGRLRLFLTKYLGGMLFVLLQSTIFAVGSYLVFGLRVGQWNASLFLIIPLATLLFSYLFAICVLIGVVTRSTLAAILLTCVFWVVCMIGNTVETTLYTLEVRQSSEARSYEREAMTADADLVSMKEHPSVLNAFGIRERRTVDRRENAKSRAEAARVIADKLAFWHRVAYGVTTFIPKTGETVELLDRELFTDADLAALRDRMSGSAMEPPEPPPTSRASPATTQPDEAKEIEAQDRKEMELRRQAQTEAEEETERMNRGRSIPWILGTSVAFEVVILGIAAWIFCRRDY